MASNIEIFLCYAHEDELLRNELARHLGALKRQGFFDVWHDREIIAGTEWESEIDKHLNIAQVILLLVSQYFIDSDYCYLVEMRRAVERHDRGEARVIPVILRPVFFQRAPFAKLMPLPTNRKPITDSSWYSLDEAFFDVEEGIRKAVEDLAAKQTFSAPVIPLQSYTNPPAQPSQAASRSRSVNAPKLITSMNQQFKKGDKVRHDKFGEGVILKSEMEQNTEFVEVQFQGKTGRKRLYTNFAKLEKL